MVRRGGACGNPGGGGGGAIYQTQESILGILSLLMKGCDAENVQIH